MQIVQKTRACRPTRGIAAWRAAGAVLGIVAVLCVSQGDAEAALPPELEEIAEAYRDHYQALQSLRVVYEEVPAPLMDREVLWKHRRTYSFPTSTFSFVVQGDKVYYDRELRYKPLGAVISLLRKEDPARFEKVNGDVRRLISFAEIERLLPGVDAEPHDETRVYDGSVLRAKTPQRVKLVDEERSSYVVKDTSEQGKTYLRYGYPHNILYAPLTPELPADNEYAQKNRIPDLVFHARGPVSVGGETLNGMECVVIDAPEFQKLWLDPKLGFALRRRQWYSDGKLIVDMRCDDFVEVAPRVWLPQRTCRTNFAGSEFPEEYRGQPYVEKTVRVRTIEANDPAHTAFFTLKPEPGAFVFDERLRPIDSEGNLIDKPPEDGFIPGVSYVQPADEADLEEVIKRAQREDGAAIEGIKHARWPWWRTLFVSLNVALVAAIAGFLLFRWRRSVRMSRNQG